MCGLNWRIVCGSTVWVVVVLAARWAWAEVPGEGALFPPEPQAQGTLHRIHPEMIRPWNLLPINVNGHWGHAAPNGQVAIYPQYEWTDYFYVTGTKTTVTKTVKKQIGYIALQSRGEWLLGPPPKDYVRAPYMLKPDKTEFEVEFHSRYLAYARFVDSGKAGFLDRDGDWFIGPSFDYADRFHEGYAVVGMIVGEREGAYRPQGEFDDSYYPDGRYKPVPIPKYAYGLINSEAQFVAQIEYDGMLRIREGMAAVMRDGKCGFIDQAGKLAIEMKFTEVRSFSDGMAAVVQPPAKPGERPTRGYIDKRGKFVWTDRDGRLDELGDFIDGLARVRIGGKWGYMDKRFRMRVEPQMDDARDFAAGKAAVRVGNTWGFIDKRPQAVLKPQFDEAWSFEDPTDLLGERRPADDDRKDTLAMFRSDRYFGYTNATQKRVIQPQFEDAHPFLRGFARVAQTPDFGYIDSHGRIVWDPRWPIHLGIRNEPAPARRVPEANRQAVWPGLANIADLRPAPFPAEHEYLHVLPNAQLP